MSREYRDADYLEHIVERIGRIKSYTEGKEREQFLEDDLLQDAVLRNLEIIGEAANKLGQTIKDRYHEIPWSEMIGMRNILVHGYASVDPDIVWDAIEN